MPLTALKQEGRNRQKDRNTYLLCTLSANDRGATKNPVVNLELILMHHFSRILRLDVSSVLSTALNSLVAGLTSRISTITQNMVNQKC